MQILSQLPVWIVAKVRGQWTAVPREGAFVDWVFKVQHVHTSLTSYFLYLLIFNVTWLGMASFPDHR